VVPVPINYMPPPPFMGAMPTQPFCLLKGPPQMLPPQPPIHFMLPPLSPSPMDANVDTGGGFQPWGTPRTCGSGSPEVMGSPIALLDAEVKGARHLSPLDIATGGRPRPPPLPLRQFAAAPAVAAPMNAELATRLSRVQQALPPASGAAGTVMMPGMVDIPIPMPIPMTAALTPPRTRPVAMCHLWRTYGACTRPKCRFVHSDDGDAHDGGGQSPECLTLPLRVCHFHRPGVGGCKKGNTCEFLHL